MIEKLKLGLAILLALSLQGCILGTAVSVTGDVVESAVNTTGAVIDVVTPDGDDDEDDD